MALPQDDHPESALSSESFTTSSQTAFLVAQMVENLPAMQETQIQKDPLEKEMAIHFSILAWKIPWTEEHDGLQSIGWQKV